MIRPETVLLVVVALLLVAGQPGVETVTTVFGGSQEVPDDVDAVLLVDGAVTVPAATRARTSLYVIGGTAHVEGTLDGRLVQFAGNVSVGTAGAVTGQYQLFGGDSAIAEGADVAPVAVAEPLTRERSPAASLGTWLLQAVGLAAVSFVLGRRYPDLLANVSHALRHHPVVSGTIGLLATVTLLALFVFMAFTIVLVPVSLLGLFGGVLVYLYAYVSVGYLLGRWVPTDRPGLATAVGSVGFMVLSRLVGHLPVVGGTVPLVVIVTAVGAVFVTYFGLREFEPPQLRPAE